MDADEIKLRALEDIYTHCDEQGMTGEKWISTYGLNGIQDALLSWMPSNNLDILTLLADMPYMLNYKPDEYKGQDFARRLSNALMIELSRKMVTDVKKYVNL